MMNRESVQFSRNKGINAPSALSRPGLSAVSKRGCGTSAFRYAFGYSGLTAVPARLKSLSMG